MRSAEANLQFLRLEPGRLTGWYLTLIASLVICLIFSRFGLTVIILLLTGSVLTANVLMRRFAAFPAIWLALPATVALWYLASAGWSAHVWEALQSAKVKGLFILLPFALLSLRGISRANLSAIYHLFAGLVTVGALWSLLQIPLRGIDLGATYAQGGVIPTVIHHIRFSLLAAFAAVFCWLLFTGYGPWRKLPRWAYAAAAVFLTGYLHILAVRSGLAGFYGAMLFLLVSTLFNGRRVGLKLALLAGAGALAMLAYQVVPTLKTKVNYTLYSLERFKAGQEDRGNYSDSRRLISYEAAWHLIQRNPWTGTGIGDLKPEVTAYHREHYPEVDPANLHPHNQYLFTAAAAGIPAALFLLVFNLALLVRHVSRRNRILVAFNVIWLLSMLVEDTLEMQIGVAAYLFFNYFGWDSEAWQQT